MLGPGRNSRDEPVLGAFSGASIGDLDGDGLGDFAMPTAGLGTGLDLLLPNLQTPSDTHVMAWDGSTGRGLFGLPRQTSDVAFFVSPALADLDRDGDTDVIAGNGVNVLDAYDGRGGAAAGFPKLTGGWTVGTPAVGDWDDDGTSEVAVMRRDGFLLVWKTAGIRAPCSGAVSGVTGRTRQTPGAPQNRGTAQLLPPADQVSRARWSASSRIVDSKPGVRESNATETSWSPCGPSPQRSTRPRART